MGAVEHRTRDGVSIFLMCQPSGLCFLCLLLLKILVVNPWFSCVQDYEEEPRITRIRADGTFASFVFIRVIRGQIRLVQADEFTPTPVALSSSV